MNVRSGDEPTGTASGRNGDGRGLLKIGDFAKLAGTNLRTLRYYEEIGLLQPATRSTGGFRYYRSEDLDRLRMVASLQRLGLELARIRELMDTRTEEREASGAPAKRNDFMGRVRQALREQVSLIDERISALGAQHDDLGLALDKLAECSACDHSPSADNNFCHPCQVDGKPLPPGLSALF